MMNKEEIKLTEYLHNIIENNMSLRQENDRLWKQKLEYIDRISKAIECIKDFEIQAKHINDEIYLDETLSNKLLEILGEKDE